MNTNELAARLESECGMTRVGARKAVDTLLEAIVAAALSGEDVSINGFGKFTLKNSPERDGRNPSTGKAIRIAASRKLGFSSAKALKDRLNA